MKFYRYIILFLIIILHINCLWSQGTVEIINDFSTDGAGIRVNEDGNQYHTSIEPDLDGEGGWFSVEGETTDHFRIDGNRFSELMATFNGNTSAVVINTGANGDDAVVMAPSSISNVEILNEAGIANALANTTTNLTSTLAPVMGRTIYCPSEGYILAIATAQCQITHATGTNSSIQMGVSDDPASLPISQDVSYGIPSNEASGAYNIIGTVHGVFSVLTGFKTFYLVANEATNTTGILYDKNLSLMFIPTAYGLTASNANGGGNSNRASQGDAHNALVSTLTTEEIEKEKEMSISHYNAKKLTEINQVKAQIEALQATMSNIDAE